MKKIKQISTTCIEIMINFPVSNKVYKSQVSKTIDRTNTAVHIAFNFLISKGLVTKIDSNSQRIKMYSLTEKGLKAREVYMVFLALCS